MKDQNMILGYVVTAVVAGGIGIFGGMTYQKSKGVTPFGQGNRPGMMQGQNADMMRGQQGNKPAGNGQGAGVRGGGMVMGEVTAKDDKTVTIKMVDGSSKIVILSDTTTYRMASDAKMDDLSVGKTVSVMGTANSDGSTTATSIELNPIARQLKNQ